MKNFLILLAILIVSFTSCVTETIKTKDFDVPIKIQNEIQGQQKSLIQDSTFIDTLINKRDKYYEYQYFISKNDVKCLAKITLYEAEKGFVAFFVMISIILFVILLFSRSH